MYLNILKCFWKIVRPICLTWGQVHVYLKYKKDIDDRRYGFKDKFRWSKVQPPTGWIIWVFFIFNVYNICSFKPLAYPPSFVYPGDWTGYLWRVGIAGHPWPVVSYGQEELFDIYVICNGLPSIIFKFLVASVMIPYRVMEFLTHHSIPTNGCFFLHPRMFHLSATTKNIGLHW